MNTPLSLYQRLPVSIRERGEELTVTYLKLRHDNRREKIKKARIRLEGFLIGAFTSAGLSLSIDEANILAKALIDEAHNKYGFSTAPKKAS